MKKLLILALISFFAVGVEAKCSINYNANSAFSKVFDTYDSWSIEKAKYDQICEKLNRANASVMIDGSSAVLNNQSLGFATVRVVDRNASIYVGSYSSSYVYANSFASQDKADELMVMAANAAIEKWTNLDKALVELDKERAQVRAAFSRQK